MSTQLRQFEYRVCYGVADRITFVNGDWQGADVPVAQRRQEHIQGCPLMWEFLNTLGAQGWELVTILETAAGNDGNAVRTYFLKRAA